MDKTQTVWTTNDITKAVEGDWISGNATLQPDQVIATGVRYSISQIMPGDLYIMPSPKWGKKYDDNSHKIQEIVSKGATVVITDASLSGCVSPQFPVMKVKDTFAALWKLGLYASNRFTGKKVCITGSVGKSTTKECLYHVLNKQASAFKSSGNFNHQFGFPLSLAQTPINYDYGIYEIAIFVLKAMIEQVKLVRPHLAIITDIQPDHLMYCKSLENIADLKARIFDALAPNGIAIINGYNEFSDRLKNHAIEVGVKKIILYGDHPESTVKVLHQKLSANNSYVKADVNGIEVEYTLQIPGGHALKNTLAVLAAVYALGADVVKAAQDLESFKPLARHTFLEQVPFQKRHIYLIDDTYSSNPASVRAGCEYANVVGNEFNSRIIAVLGDIQELGESSAELHANLAQVLIENNVKKAFLIGKHMVNLWNNLPLSLRGAYTQNADRLCSDLFDELRENDTVLVKTSRRTYELLPIIHALKKPNQYLRSKQNRIKSNQKSNENFFKIVKIRSLTANQCDLIFVGDMSPGENYQEKLSALGFENILKTRGYDYPMMRVKNFLFEADVVVANLETPLTSIKESPYKNQKDYIHWSDINQTPICLLKHNIHFVTLANNHAYDYGKAGLEETFSILNKNKITYFGGGKDAIEANAPLILKINLNNKEIHIAVIGMFEESERYREKYDVYAENNKPGTASLNIKNIEKTIQQLKQYDPNIYIIVSPHWGDNYQWKSKSQVKNAEALIDAGVDLIIGHGAHRFQEIEQIRDRWVLYSIGNFMFNSPGRYQKLKAPPYSFIVNLVVELKNNDVWVNTRLYPIVTDNLKTNYQTRVVDQPEFDEICTLLASQNTSLSTPIHSLKRDKDHKGYYIELPPELIVSKSIGMICDTEKYKNNPRNTAQYWVYRAHIMDGILKEREMRLFAYSPSSVNLRSRRAVGYTIEGEVFTKTVCSVPLVNYSWLTGNHRLAKKYNDFLKFCNRVGILYFPRKSLTRIADDKLLSFQLLESIVPGVNIYTEPYRHSIEQVYYFLNQSHIVFIKPRWGGGGNGIMVLKKKNNEFILTIYKNKKILHLHNFDLHVLLLEVKEYSENKELLIQIGIDVPRFKNKVFDIRFIMLNDGEKYHAIYESRLGRSKSDLSNISQGGSHIETKTILVKLFGEKKAKEIIENMTGSSFKIIETLEKQRREKIIELAIDWIINFKGQAYLSEINTNIGIAGHPHLFFDYFNMDLKERITFEKYAFPHAAYITEFLYSKYTSLLKIK